MNKYSESYNMLKDIVNDVKNDVVVIEVLKDMHELVERATPKSFRCFSYEKANKFPVIEYECKTCKELFITYDDEKKENVKYCMVCGQALKWSDEE